MFTNKEITDSPPPQKNIGTFDSLHFIYIILFVSAVSGAVLHEILENFADRVTNIILMCLVPPHTKQLNLNNCSLITSAGVQNLLKR